MWRLMGGGVRWIGTADAVEEVEEVEARRGFPGYVQASCHKKKQAWKRKMDGRGVVVEVGGGGGGGGGGVAGECLDSGT
jgi:predicted glycosyltransferase